METQITHEEFLIGMGREEEFKRRLNDIKAVLDMEGVHHWTDENLERLVMSGPVGFGSWALTVMGRLREEFKRATVMIRELDEDVTRSIEHVVADRQATVEADRIWNMARLQFHGKVDQLSSMRKEDLKAKKHVGGGGGQVGGLYGGSGSASMKRRSIYGDDKKGKKKVRVGEKEKGVSNPFEPKRGTPARRSETVD